VPDFSRIHNRGKILKDCKHLCPTDDKMRRKARSVGSDWKDVYRQEKRRPAYVLENGKSLAKENVPAVTIERLADGR
jgi:hypothetical protein